MNIFSNKQNCQIFHRILLEILEKHNFSSNNKEVIDQISCVLKKEYQIEFDYKNQIIGFESVKQQMLYSVKYG
jgi:hypothetical protein